MHWVSLFFSFSQKKKKKKKKIKGFHDMIADTSLTFLLEESAGTQDGDLIASTLWLYCHHFIARDKKELILVMDNCRLCSFFCLFSSRPEPTSPSFSKKSVNKNYKILAFCQLLVDVGQFETIRLFFLFENHAKGSFVSFASPSCCHSSFACSPCQDLVTGTLAPK